MDWPKQIQLQIDRHRHVNLLSPRPAGLFSFTRGTQEMIGQIAANRLSEKEERDLLAFTTAAVLSSLYRVNQFYQFDKKAQAKLAGIYHQLLQDIKSNNGRIDVDGLAGTHYRRLQQWLTESQPEAQLLYPSARPFIENEVPCAEYSPAIQLQLLGIELSQLIEPVLDLGCGKRHRLVNYLRAKGLDVYGIDRDVTPGKNILRSSWLDHSFKAGSWGTVISHLGFTNHFNHHHLKANSDHLLYARKYVELLQSLKVGGTFYYAPDLPFIEIYLDNRQYSLQKQQVPQTTYYATAVRRLT